MDLEWMGRYRELVSALVKHGNICARAINTKKKLTDTISLTAQEWQVLEYIIEHESDDESMILMSSKLGIPQSSFSKFTKLLCSYQLVCKYQLENNKKNIILKPTDKGRELYAKHAKALSTATFNSFFDALESLPDETLAQVAAAITALNGDMQGEEPPKPSKLIKLQ